MRRHPHGRFMVFDSRYPHMFRLEHAPGVCPNHRARMIRVVQSICRRTGIRASFNARFQNVLLHWTAEPDSGPIALEMYGEDGQEKRYSDRDIEDAILLIRMAQRPRAEKERIARNNKQREDWAKEDIQNSVLDDIGPDANDLIRFRDAKRRGVSKVISA